MATTIGDFVSDTNKHFDLIIVGNGAIGCAVAFELQRRNAGLSVAIVGHKNRAGSASAAAGAMLNVFAEIDAGLLAHPLHRAKFDLARQATAAWPRWVADLEDAAGPDGAVPIRLGTFVLKNAMGGYEDDEAYAAISHALDEHDEPHEIVDAKSIKGYVPSVEARASQAIYIPREGALDPRQLLSSYFRAFAAGKIVTAIDAAVDRVELGTTNTKRVVATDGSVLTCEQLLVAAGAETRNLFSQWPDLHERLLPLFYGVGAALLLDARVEAPECVVRTPNRALACGLHLVPQGGKQVYVGASNQISPGPEFSPRLTSVHFLMQGAMQQFNANYYNAELRTIFLGYRPTSADALPMIGETSAEGVFVITGTKRDGLHISPIYAQDIADRILGKAGVMPDDFKPERKVIRWLSKERGRDLAVRHLFSAALQHGLKMPHSNWDPMVDEMLRDHVDDIYEKAGVDYGIPPELLDMYRYGHITQQD